MSLDRLEAMTEVELDAYFAEALKVCPPIKVFGGETTPKKSVASKLIPRTALGEQLMGMSPEKQKLAKMAAQLGLSVDTFKGIK